MMQDSLRFRQVHLDFHTSGAIPGIGSRFDKKKYQETLKRAEVDSVTTFAVCHHGWAYYDTKVGKRHPHLSFDLLRAQYEACKEIGINVPIYITAGVNNLAADENPGWREIDPEGRFSGWATTNIEPGFKMLSFHSPYLDFLCELTGEVVDLFPEADGIFFDIINQGEDCSVWALQHMVEKGLDPTKSADRGQSRFDALMKYYERTTEAVRSRIPDMPVFHNSGHVTPGFRDILPSFSHLELESLPTGGWGYDHFPFLAKYAHQLRMDYLGMTGKFHSTWGEFGGYKHPNALRYECCAMLAYGARCSVGDQLHPTGEIDPSTYEIIGEAYREVARKESFVKGARNVADIGLLSSLSVRGEEAFRQGVREAASDIGAARVLLEEHQLFDVIDGEMDFSPYRMMILPDDGKVEGDLLAKLREYVADGGRLFLSGDSAVDPGKGLLFDAGCSVGDRSPFQPDFWLPREGLRADFVNQPMVMYGRARRVEPGDGESLGEVYDPYFNREWDHFCSHQHTPPSPDPSGFVGGSRKEGVTYLSHPVFTIYRGFGQVALRQALGKHLDLALGGDRTVTLRGFPSAARVVLSHQPEHRRYILHLLNGCTINRGGEVELHGGTLGGRLKSYEVIEEVRPLHGVEVDLRIPEKAVRTLSVPEGEEIKAQTSGKVLTFRLVRVDHHAMVAVEY